MNNFLNRTRGFIAHNRVQVVTVAILVAIICLVSAVSIYQSHRFAYSAVKACDLLTENIAKELLGEKVIGITSGEPTTENNIATSKCSYTDSNPSTDDMKVAAIGVVSPRNADAKKTIETSFQTAKSSTGVQSVREIGDSAFFDKSVGQLNVLSDTVWMKFNFGNGESIEKTTVDDLLSFAEIILAEYNNSN